MRRLGGQRPETQAVQAAARGRPGMERQRGCDLARGGGRCALDLDVVFTAVGESQRDTHDAAGVTGD